MARAAARLRGWARTHARTVWWALGAVVVLGGAAAAFLVLAREPELPAIAHTEYVSAQRSLHAMEAIAQLTVLRSAIEADRPTQDLQSRLGYIREELEWALASPGIAGPAWGEVVPELDVLRRQIFQEDPAAADTVIRLRDLLHSVGEVR